MWTKERIQALSPGEIKSLRKNAIERGANDVAALCDEVLGPKLKATGERSRRAKPLEQHPRRVSRKRAFEMRGVTLRNPRWSWGGIRPADGMPVLTLWADEIKKAEDGSECLLWAPNVDGSRPWEDSLGGKERFAHCEAAAAKGEGEGVLIYGARRGKDLPNDEASKFDGADPHTVIRFRLEQRGPEYWAVWGGAMADLDAQLPPK